MKDHLKEDKKDKAEKVRDMLRVNKAAALGLAVLLTVSTALTGCMPKEEEEEEDDSYFSTGGGGGGYYYHSGGSYRYSSWGKTDAGSSTHSYSTHRAGSVGG